MAAEIKVAGLFELGQAMRGLSAKVSGKLLRQAVAAGANVVKTAAKDNVKPHRKSGDLENAIDTRRSRTDSGNGVESRDVGVFKLKGFTYANTRRNRQLGRVGKQYETGPPSFYWRFLEFGTVKQGATPFLRPALDNNVQPAIDAMAGKLRDGILKAGG